MQKANEFCEHLIFMAKNRESYYDNSFPGNCCQIHDRGVISADCIGLVKGLINDPDIWKKLKPAGYYAQPGKNIGDWTERGILDHCSSVSSDFRNIQPGEYLFMSGHAGIYTGSFFDGDECNVVECTTDFGDNGITSSWLDLSTGRRFDHRGGREWRSWEKHGRLSDWITYDQPAAKDVVYQVYDDVYLCWLENVEGLSDYAGVFGHDIDCVYASFAGADLYYKVHTWKGDAVESYPDYGWLPEVKNREDYAGIYKHPIDAFMIRSANKKYKVRYRLHLRKKNIWLDWVNGYDEKDPEYGYAGIIGEPADALQIQIITV